MTDHNVIPADQWPEDAVLHTWDEENGQGYWTVYDKVGGFWTIRSSHIHMPEGWDWRVPVMRPVTETKGGEQIADIVADWDANRCGPFKAMKRIKKHLDSLTFQPGNDLHIGYEAGMKLARHAAPQPAPAIDLEQFRDAVEAYQLALHDDLCLDPSDLERNDEYAKRLLALIDGSKNNNLPHVGDINVVVSQPNKREET